MTTQQCACGRAAYTHKNECRKCYMDRLVNEQDKRNRRARRERNIGHISNALLFAGILIDT